MKIAARIGVALVAVSGTLLLVGASAAAPATRTPFSGTGSFVSESGGSPSFPDGNFHMRGFQQVYNVVVSDPRVSGTDTVMVNFNFRLVPAPVVFTGPMWGTEHLENAGGYWDATWTGVRSENGFAFLDAVGHGGGGYEGLHVTWHLERLSPDPYADWSVSGTILDPRGA